MSVVVILARCAGAGDKRENHAGCARKKSVNPRAIDGSLGIRARGSEVLFLAWAYYGSGGAFSAMDAAVSMSRE